MPAPRRSLRLVLLGAALYLVAFGAAFGATHLVEQARHRRVSVEARRLGETAAARARDSVLAELEALRLGAHNAASNSRLVAAIGGRVDARTFQDLFATEAWWAPYRRGFDVAITYEGGALAFRQDGFVADPADVGTLASQVRQTGESRAAVVSVPSGAALLAAAVVPMRDGVPAVLLVSRRLDAASLISARERAAGPVLVTNGSKVLASVGEGDELARLTVLMSDPARSDARTAWGAASVPLERGLWLWSGARAERYARDEAAGDRLKQGAVWAIAGLAPLLVLLPLRRRSAHTRTTADLATAGTVPNLPAFIEPGATVLGRYLLLEKIAEGGMAHIFTAATFGAHGFRRRFVIKRLRPELTTSPEAVGQFVDEANLASSLVHPNVVPVYDFGSVGHDHYLAMEYIVGRDLGRLTRRMVDRGEPALSRAAVFYVAHEVLSGLGYAHARRDDEGRPMGIVHRDVSPENIMVSESGEVKLLDFGIVKATQNRVARTEAGQVKGNVDYMAPEQARGRQVDPRADLFSLGLVMYYALAQRPLYRGETVYDSLMRAAHGLTPDDLQGLAALGPEVHQVLSVALAADPDARFQTAEAFREAVSPFIAGGREEIVRVMLVLFEDELRLEEDRLSAALPRRDDDSA